MAEATEFHRSYSAVSTLRQCGEQYRLKKVEGVAQRPSAAAIAGKAIHKATELVDLELESSNYPMETLEAWGTDAVRAAIDEFAAAEATEQYPVEAFRAFGMSKANPGGQNISWFREVGAPGCVTNYIWWRLNSPHLAIAIGDTGELLMEYEFVLNLGGQDIWGAVDRVFTNVNNGTNLVLDIKSGVKPKSSEQLGLYRVALNEAFPDLNITYGAYLYGLKPGSKTGVRLTPDIDLRMWSRERFAAIYGAADRQIQQNLFLPNPGDACFLCDVSQHCDFYPASNF